MESGAVSGGSGSKFVKVGDKLVEGVGCDVDIIAGSGRISRSVVWWCKAGGKELMFTGYISSGSGSSRPLTFFGHMGGLSTHR